ncbi:phage tail protein [Nocardiopsis protaetiae]|uniref:phage tail protein n=1 Tax=Nocardiopsis protaetiae TaxID=3382270 RepID=UPI00387A92FA
MATTRMVGRVSVRVMPDTRRFRADLLKDLQALEKSLSVSIPTRIDTKRVARDAARVKADVERQLGSVRVGVNVDTGGVEAQLGRATRDREAEIEPVVDGAALARVRRLLDSLARSAGRLVGGSAALGAGAGGLSALAAGAASAIVPILQLGTAIAPAVGILAALPAAATTAAAALAPLVLAFRGMGDALGAALSGDAEALEEALEGLAPAAQDVVRAVAEMAPAFQRLQQVVQQNFFAPLADSVSQLGERLLPVLGQGMALVSRELGLSAANFAEFLGHRRNAQALSELFASTARSLENSRGTMPALVAGFRELSLVGLPFIERAASGLREGALEWSAWAQAAAESGDATRWIENALTVLSQLGDIAGNVGGILGSIFTAAGDGGILATLESLTGELDRFFASAEGGAALEGVFEGLASVGSALSPVLTSLASGIGTIAPMVGRLAEGIGPVLTSAINGLAPALTRLEPGLMAVIDGLGQGVDALVESGALDAMGTALSDILTAVSPLLPVLGELAGVLGLALADALTALAPGLEILARELAETIGPMLPELSESFGDLVEAIAPLIPPLVEALIPGLELLPPIIELLIENFDTWAGTISDLTPQIITIIGWIGTLGGWVVRLVGWVLELLAAWLRWAGETSQKLRDALREMGDRVRDFADRARARFDAFLLAVRTIWAAIRTAVVTAATRLRDQAIAAFARLVSGAGERVRNLVTVATSLPRIFRTAVSGFGSLLYNAGRNVIQGLINGVRSKLGALRTQMANVAGQVRGALPFSPAKYGPLRTHPPDIAGETIGRMVADGLKRSRQIVAAAAGDMAGGAVLEIDSSPLAPASDGADRPIVVDGRGLDRALVEWLRRSVRVDSRGDVGLALNPGR